MKLPTYNATTIIALALACTSFSFGAPPEFNSGEVLLRGAPKDHPNIQVVRYYPHSNVTVARVSKGREHSEMLRHRRAGKNASLNLKVTKFFSSNDPYSGLQWHFDNIQVEQAWTVSTGAGAVVAVLDTGFRHGGNDSVTCTVSGWDVVNSDSDPTDGDGHGTHVSGTVAQASDNGIGVAGVAHSSCLMPVKVLDDTGSGSFADIAEGIHFAVDNGAHVINMSLGVPAYYGITNDIFVDAALDYAYANDVTVVAAAGNDGYPFNVSYPSIYPTVISVGATDYRNRLTRYSNRGLGLDIVAPGGDLTRDRNNDGFADGVLQETFDGSGFSYWFFQGTSMSSPHVAATAALLVSSGVATTPDTIRAALESSALDLGLSGYDSRYGHGLVQAFDALNTSSPTPPAEEPTDPPTEEPTPPEEPTEPEEPAPPEEEPTDPPAEPTPPEEEPTPPRPPRPPRR